MLIHTGTNVAMRCAKCSSVNVSQVSLFALSPHRASIAHCRCGARLFSMEREGRILYLRTRCRSCGEAHEFPFDARSFCQETWHEVACPVGGHPLAIVGQVAQGKAVAALPEEPPALDQDVADEYFEDPEIMYQTLNHLHDLAGGGGVSCRCGSPSAEVEIFPDRVVLRCASCGRYWMMHARDQNDLARLKKLPNITMSELSAADRSRQDRP
ncbi:MAG: hypothetical protein AB1445_06360 [Bacillota bacterium]